MEKAAHESQSGGNERQGRPRSSVRVRLSTELVLVLVNVAIFIGMAIATDSFLTPFNIGNLFRQSAIIGIVAISSTVVIISGGIDLSVGSLAGLSAMVSAVLMSTTLVGMPILPAVLIAIAAGTVVGFYHGFIIHDVRLPPFIATLGSMYIVRGIVKLISGAQTIAYLPKAYTQFAVSELWGIPALVIAWLIVAVVVHIVLNYTRFGRNIYVIGSSQEVARLSGIRMRANIYGVYVLAAFLCALAGALLTSRLSSAVPTGGQGYELTAIAAAVIGGASLSGARGSVLGTVLGTLLMGLISNAGVHLNIDPFLLQSITGVLLTVAVVLDMLRQRRK